MDYIETKKSYLLVEISTGIVTNAIELIDQDKLPPLPDESERPIEPAKPNFSEPPRAPTVLASASDDITAMVARAHAKQVAAWELDCKDKQAKYEEDITAYNNSLNEFHFRAVLANKYKWTPPDGFKLVPLPADSTVLFGVTIYENGELVNPVEVTGGEAEEQKEV